MGAQLRIALLPFDLRQLLGIINEPTIPHGTADGGKVPLASNGVGGVPIGGERLDGALSGKGRIGLTERRGLLGLVGTLSVLGLGGSSSEVLIPLDEFREGRRPLRCADEAVLEELLGRRSLRSIFSLL